MPEAGAQVFSTDRRTDLLRGLPWFVLAGGLAAAVAVVGLVVGSPVLSGCAGVALSISLLLVLMARTTIGTVTIGAGTIDQRRWTGRHVMLPLDDRLRAMLALYVSSLPHSANRRRLVIRSADHGPRISLLEPMWSPEQLDSIASAVGAETTDEWLEARDWQQRAPGLIPWRERHWVWSIVAVSIGFWAAAIGLIALIDLMV